MRTWSLVGYLRSTRTATPTVMTGMLARMTWLRLSVMWTSEALLREMFTARKHPMHPMPIHERCRVGRWSSRKAGSSITGRSMTKPARAERDEGQTREHVRPGDWMGLDSGVGQALTEGHVTACHEDGESEAIHP